MENRQYKLISKLTITRVIEPQTGNWHYDQSYEEINKIFSNTLDELNSWLDLQHPESDEEYIPGWDRMGRCEYDGKFDDYIEFEPNLNTYQIVYYKDDFMADGYWLQDDDGDDFWVSERREKTNVVYFLEEDIKTSSSPEDNLSGGYN